MRNVDTSVKFYSRVNFHCTERMRTHAVSTREETCNLLQQLITYSASKEHIDLVIITYIISINEQNI